jgi:trimethylamine--corrinoid protein Co-methyltransferase
MMGPLSLKPAIPTFRLLSEEQRLQLLGVAQEVMQRTGLRIQHEEVLAMIRKAGGVVEDDIAHFPRNLVERCIKLAPKSFQLYTRQGEPAIRMGEGLSYFGAGVGAPFIVDLRDGSRRPFLRKDMDATIQLQDALPNLDFVMAMGEISDIPDPELADLYRFYATLANTSKPVNFMSTSLRNTSDMIEMAAIIAGGENHLREKPFIALFGAGSTPPLTYLHEKLDRLLLCCEKGIPFVSLSAAGSGGTAPVTLAGHIVSGLADILAAVVISQIKTEGARIMIGAIPLVMDMKTMTYAYGAPEVQLVNAAVNEIVHSLGLPSYGTAGITDSKLLDEQAAIEATASSYFQALTRTNLIHDVGFLDSALVVSLDMLTLSDEIIGMVRRFCRGIDLDDEHLAVDVIHQVGPGGHYVGEMHTVKHFREEQWWPQLISRENFQAWSQKGSTSLKERVHAKTVFMIHSHQPVSIENRQRERMLAILHKRGLSV